MGVAGLGSESAKQSVEVDYKMRISRASGFGLGKNPGVYLISPPKIDASFAFDLEEVFARLSSDSLPSLFQLRLKDGNGKFPSGFDAEISDIMEVCRAYGVLLVVNDNVDLALKIGADGVHFGIEDMPDDVDCLSDSCFKVFGFSCYNRPEYAKSVAETVIPFITNRRALSWTPSKGGGVGGSNFGFLGTDSDVKLASGVRVRTFSGDRAFYYVSFGSLFRTVTKPGAPRVSLDVLDSFGTYLECNSIPVLICGIGGLNSFNVEGVVSYLRGDGGMSMGMGSCGVDLFALSSAVWSRSCASDRARELERIACCLRSDLPASGSSLKRAA